MLAPAQKRLPRSGALIGLALLLAQIGAGTNAALAADVTGTITPGGPSVTVTVSNPNDNANISFSGTAGKRVSLKWTGSTGVAGNVSIRKPSGSTIGSSLISSGYVDTQSLTETGTYSIYLDPFGSATGSWTLTLYDVPPDVGGAITPGGPAVTETTTTPGQNARYSWSGNAGQRVFLKVSNVTLSSYYENVSILKPDGSTLASSSAIGNNGSGFIDTQTLPTSGTYTVLVNPASWATGSTTLTLEGSPGNTLAPSVSGDPGTEETLTADAGEWNGSQPISYSYQWRRCDSANACTSLSGATQTTYLLADADIGFALKVQVTATNTLGTATTSSASTAAVASFGHIRYGCSSVPYGLCPRFDGDTLNDNGDPVDPINIIWFPFGGCCFSGAGEVDFILGTQFAWWNTTCGNRQWNYRHKWNHTDRVLWEMDGQYADGDCDPWPSERYHARLFRGHPHLGPDCCDPRSSLNDWTVSDAHHESEFFHDIDRDWDVVEGYVASRAETIGHAISPYWQYLPRAAGSIQGRYSDGWATTINAFSF